MTPEEEYRQLYEDMAKLCAQQGWGDPFSYARSKEIYAATVLGHTVAKDFSGGDATDPEGNEFEYKSTTGPTCKGAYTGVSVQSSWEEQEDYLLNDKIGKYSKHYFNRFKDGKMVESWMIPGDVACDILLPKFKKKFPTVLNKKDPRLSANVTWTEIKKYGKKII